MTTQSELEQWTEEVGIISIRSGDALLFDLGDPYCDVLDLPLQDMSKLEIRDGAVVLDWNYDGYGEQRFESIAELEKRWLYVVEHGLEG